MQPCFEDETHAATCYCRECGFSEREQGILCQECFTRIHANSRSLKAHKSVPLARLLPLFRELESRPTDKDFHDDSKNLFCFVSIESKAAIALGPQFLLLGDSHAPENINFCSFLGPTGAGKSFLMRSLCASNGTAPLSGDAATTQSTSSDVRAYKSNISDELILFDSEGSGGTAPLAAGKIASEIQALRDGFVHVAYPRFLYIFSDVLCFVFQGAHREKKTIVDTLRMYGAVASSLCTNKALKPALLVIFNRVCDKEKYEQAPDKAWFDGAPADFWNYYQQDDTHVVYMPDARNRPVEYLHQQDVLTTCLKEKVARAQRRKADACVALPIGRVKLLMAAALSRLSDNYEAKFDLLELALASRPLATETPDFLFELFSAIYIHYRKAPGYPQVEAFKAAWQLFTNRLLHSYFQVCQQAQVERFVGLQMSPGFITTLRKAHNLIWAMRPCGAVWPKSDRKAIMCEVACSHHSAGHQSYELFSDESAPSGILGGWFRSPSKAPCRWDGAFEEPAGMPSKSLDVLAQEQFATYVITDNKQQQQRYQHVPDEQEKQVVRLLRTTRVCVVCGVNLPVIPHTCGHVLCEMCARHGTCGVCALPGLRLPPPPLPYTRPRVLSLDGGGIRGVITLRVLLAIEDRLFRLPVCQLFDLIVGTSAGAIIAAAIAAAESPLSVTDCLKLFSSMGERVFKRQSKLPDKAALLKNGFLYERQPLHEFLTDFLGKQSLFRPVPPALQLPKVAITSCTHVRSSELECVLFTSYNRASRSDLRPIVLDYATVVEAVEASAAAGTYFPVFYFRDKPYTDGGMCANNPCLVAFDEAAAVWGSGDASTGPVDVLVSIGTGHSDAHTKLEDGVVTFAKIAAEIATATEGHWKSLKDRIKKLPPSMQQKYKRFNPRLAEDYKLDSVEAKDVEGMLREAKEAIDNEADLVTDICAQILAAQFYVAVQETSLHQGTIIGAIKLRCTATAELIASMKETSFRASVTPPAKLTVKFDWTRLSTAPFSLPIIIAGLTSEDDTLSIYCCIVKSSNGEDVLIAGCPLNVGRIGRQAP